MQIVGYILIIAVVVALMTFMFTSAYNKLLRNKNHANETWLNIVKETYDTALKNGDNNIYFIAGNELIRGELIETATVDNCHPNDTGFLSMALSIEPVIKRIFNI